MTDVDKALSLSKRAAEFTRRVKVASYAGVEHLDRLAEEAMEACERSRVSYESLAPSDRAEFDARWPQVFASIAS